MRRVCVFAGSSAGQRPEYRIAAEHLGRALAGRGMGLVYGGAHVGLMGALADAAIEAGGEVIGVIPQALVDKEVAHHGLADLRIVHSMHERKALMAELSDGFVAMPGGWGTLEELFEILTWGQLGLHQKPCGLLNVAGYFDGLQSFLAHAVDEGFLRRAHTDSLLMTETVDAMLDALGNARPAQIDKWINRSDM
jgi:uncharacterized protein (TIGR00730 family)